MNDTTLTIAGNLVDDPGAAVHPRAGSQWHGSAPRRPRGSTTRLLGQWKDGETLFLSVNVWRQAAENAAESLSRGTRAIVTGRLRQRSYEKDGEKRTVYELEADEVGVSLRSAVAKVTKATRTGGNGGQRQAEPDPWAAEASAGYSDEPPF